VDTRIAELVQLIRAKYISTEALSKPMDFARKIQFLTLDVISDIGFGEAFGDLRADADVNDYIRAGEEGLMVSSISMALGLTDFMQIPFIARWLGPSEKDAAGFGRIMANARSTIETRLQRDTEKSSDMLASFIRHGLDADELLTESTLQIVAGSDTTAAALRGIMLYLVSHPRVYVKLQAELDAAERDGVAPPLTDIISDTAVRKLPYLQAVIKEGIRIHPPVTDQVPKRVPDGGDTVVVDGKPVFLPGGTNIGYAALPLNMREDTFGPDAHEFRPERWLLEKDSARLAAMNRTHELIFGYGKYQCLGKPVALMEIGKTVFEVPPPPKCL
jgi:cytochrome P450